MAKRKTRTRRTSRPSRPKSGGVSKKTMPKALKDKLEDIQVAKSLQADVLEDIRFNNQSAPFGYTFLKKGDTYLTRKARSLALAEHETIYVVYCYKTYKPTGLYVPIQILEIATAEAEVTADTRKRKVELKDARDRKTAQSLLEREFPEMPDVDVTAVLDHAFLKGSGRVGRSGTMKSEEEKVRLAVEAHIRHVHTDYEKLIKDGMDRDDARDVVWDTTKKVKENWAK